LNHYKIAVASQLQARLNKTLSTLLYLLQVESERQVTEFSWDQAEEDSVSKDEVLKELNHHLDLPGIAVLITLERKILFRYEGVHENKRTKLTGKTDYAIVLKKALDWILMSPQESLHYMVMLFETKVPSAMNKLLPKCRGAAAVECLAANLLLQEQGYNALPEGLPIVLTDMNRYESQCIMLRCILLCVMLIHLFTQCFARLA
jgi:hypothetical protein